MRQLRRLSRPLLLSALLAIAVAGLASTASAQAANSADRLIMWVDCGDLVNMTDSQIDYWHSLGVDGFVCESGRLWGMGGTHRFTGNLSALGTSASYSFEKSLYDSNIVGRLKARGMSANLAVYLTNYYNTSTPLDDWFDDSGWSGTVLPDMSDLAAAAKSLGFAGIAFDNELYTQVGGAQSASWGWNYLGNTHTETQVRAQARLRGQQIMQALLQQYPGIEIAVYGAKFPQSWGEDVQKLVNGASNAFANNLDINFLDGLSGASGYSAIRLYDAEFYKTASPGSWQGALQYDFNGLYSLFSQPLSNWSYASAHVFLSPFSWIDPGPCTCAFDDAQSPTYVATQLNYFRNWGMGGEFANYAYNSLTAFDYSPYAGAMTSASSPGVVDSTQPTISVNPASVAADGQSAAVSGSAGDDYAVRDVRWSTSGGASGTAPMTWNVGPGSSSTST